MTISRRGALISTIGLPLIVLFRSSPTSSQSANPPIAAFISEFEKDSSLSADNYGFREFAENFPRLNLERAPSKIKPSKLNISDDAIKLIIAFEISSKQIYEQKYRGAIWPGGRSGVTVGVGYDVGYVKSNELQSDWREIISAAQISALAPACGLTGEAAQAIAPTIKIIDIPYDDAYKQFSTEIRKYTSLAQKHLPNFSNLPEDCRGALVSLTYNRGPSFDVPESSDPSNRYREMRSIRRHMAQGSLKNIPEELRNMSRIWPSVKGLVRRREAEAALFEQGLSKRT